MRRILHLTILFCVVFSAHPACARLRTLGTIASIGLFDEDVSHIAIMLEGCEWDAVLSKDGGQTWQVAKKAQLPDVLGKLPASGQTRYMVIEGEQSLIRSDDGGQSWRDVSPWHFLDHTIREDVKAEKQFYLRKYGFWLPDDNGCYLVFGITTLLLLTGSVWGSWRQPRQWILPALLSLMTSFLIGLGLFLTHAWFIRLMTFEQWSLRLGHWDNGVAYPLWPVGVLLNLTGNVWLAPLTALLCFPITPIFGAIAGKSSRWTKFRTVAAVSAVLAIASLVTLTFTNGIGHGSDYVHNYEQNGDLNGNQPIH